MWRRRSVSDSSEPRSTRAKLVRYVLLPAVIVAVGVLAYFTFRTTLQLETLRKQSVLEATLALANEKATRLDRQIIDQDNVIVAIADPARVDELNDTWLPTAQRETPSVRAILVLDETRTVVGFASRARGPFAEEEAFRRLLTERLLDDMPSSQEAPEQLRHLHRTYGAESYLVSYWRRSSGGKTFTVCAWHDIGRIVKETLPTLYGDKLVPVGLGIPQAGINRANVVDEEGRIVFGPPLRSGEFTVAVRFPTTLYNWRVQVSPVGEDALTENVKQRRLLEIATVGLSFVVLVAGVLTILFAAETERRASALKSEFVANVSHELKTPLALVRMFAEMLQSGRVASDEKRAEYLEIIVRESERLTSLIENVLDFAKVERGHASYDFVDGDLAEVVRRAVGVYRYRAEREGVEIRFEEDETLPVVRLDGRAIELVVINLLDNALKYAQGGKTIFVEVRKRGEKEVVVAVRDEGPGIPDAEKERIFERFVRGATAQPKDGRSPVRGSGIGLSLVRAIVEAHAGRTWVESEAGRGATFHFVLPSRRADGA
ncbi:MAG: HAMP domain-containing sensor histidine kinase [Polyangiaceae bacterium]